MQDHDFEKRVHLKLEEMKLLPSEDVWEKVELRLHQKEERRRWFIWLPLLLAALCLGSYWTWSKLHTSAEKYSSSLSTTQKANQTNNLKKSSPIIYKESTKAGKDSGTSSLPANPPHINDKQKNSINNTITTNQFKSRDKHERDDHLTHQQISAGTANPSASYKLPTDKKSQDVISKHEILPSPKDNLSGISQAENKTAVTTITGAELFVQQEVTTKELFPVVVRNYSLPSKLINTSLLFQHNDFHSQVVTKLQQANKRWQWGFSFQAGRSSLTSGSLTSLFGGTQMDMLSNNPSLQPNGNNSPGAISKEPSPLKSSIGFSAGIVAKKQLSRTFAISIGLNYTLYSTTNLVGFKIDSSMTLQNTFSSTRLALDQFYRLGSTVRYSNKYHFIELPVLLQTRLIRSPRIPVYWDLGFSVSKLLTSNALGFDYVSGVYYKDKNLLNKTQFNVITGLPVSLFSTRKFALQAGPEFRYGLTDVYKSGANSEKNFIYLGLKANLLFGKK